MTLAALRRAIGACALAIAAGAAAPAPMPTLRFAIDQDYTPQTETVARVAQDFALMRALDIHILRTGIGWDDTNPHPESFRWHFWSAVAAEARAQGVALRPYYAYTPAWAGAAYNAPPHAPAAFARACGVLAAVLGSKIDSVEIWNEPDNANFWTGDAARFGQTLAPCANAIHALRPKATVVQGGLLYLDSTFFARMGEEAARGIDVAAYHEYTETPWDATTVERDNSPGYYDGGYDGLSDHGRRPVWMDEGGASTAASQNYSEATQASWIRRTVISVLSHPGRPVSLIGLYQLRDPDPKSSPIGNAQARVFFRHTGLFTTDGQLKLAAHTTADLVRLLDGHAPQPFGGARYIADTGARSAMLKLYDLRLEDGRQIICLWDRLASSSGRIILPVAGHMALLHAPNGSVTPEKMFDGRSIDVPALHAGDIPLLYEVR